jgi:hypothetical protein
MTAEAGIRGVVGADGEAEHIDLGEVRREPTGGEDGREAPPDRDPDHAAPWWPPETDGT